VVNIGNAKWADKIGAGVIGWFVFAPLAVTAIVGSVETKKLPGEIFAQIESYIAGGGHDMYLGSDTASASAGMQICPHCNSEVPLGQQFCGKCGGSLTSACPSCGANVPFGTKFCPSCGKPMDLVKTVKCPKCGTECPEGTLFCMNCGTKLTAESAAPAQVICPKCGGVNEVGDLFCAECGEKLAAEPQTKSCPQCGKELPSDKAFCPRCGHKFE
jgi:predicted amidophosphoribosyltransferase